MNRRRYGGLNIFGYVPPRINSKGKIEKHLPGANYIGPGTDLIRRVNEHVKPTTKTDALAMRHDIDYYDIGRKLQNNIITKDRARDMVRESDNRLIKGAKRNLISINPLNMAHAAATSTGIGVKKLAEDIDIIDELKFVGGGKKKDPLKRLKKKFKSLKV